jgi:hypothetical protein
VKKFASDFGGDASKGASSPLAPLPGSMTSLTEFVDALLDAHMPIAQIMIIESAKPDPDIERVRDALNNALARLEPRFGEDLRLATSVLAAIPAEMHENILLVPDFKCEDCEAELRARRN